MYRQKNIHINHSYIFVHLIHTATQLQQEKGEKIRDCSKIFKTRTRTQCNAKFKLECSLELVKFNCVLSEAPGAPGAMEMILTRKTLSICEHLVNL